MVTAINKTTTIKVVRDVAEIVTVMLELELLELLKLVNYYCLIKLSNELTKKLILFSRSTGADGEVKKENYIPRVYNKEDEDLFETVTEGINFQKFDNIPVQVSGENIPEPIQRFSEIAKDPSVVEAVKKSGYQTLTPIQKYGIAIVMNKRDLMASAQTGKFLLICAHSNRLSTRL